MPRILVVDDEQLVRNSVQRALRHAGHDVACAANGMDALALAERDPIDLAIIDYRMPEMNGLEVLTRLKAVRPGCVSILSSAALDLSVVIDAVNNGAVAHVLRKPYMPTELLSAVGQALSDRERIANNHTKRNGSGAHLGPHIQSALKECLGGEFINLAIQPIVKAGSSDVVAYEALLRSTHPVLNNVLEVLKAAEAFGAIGELAAVVVDRAERWLAHLPPPTKLFLNLHPSELGDPEGLRHRLERVSHFSDRLVLEITERSRVLDFEAWRTSTEMLRRMGFSLAVDDLGAGYSSLSVLAEIKPKYMKIDMSIVRGVEKDSHRRALIELLCRFGQSMRSAVIAEGVETDGEAQALRECGADMLQGYLFGAPSLEGPVIQ